MTRLVIVRHGNTFGPKETPRRVGGRTDLPLVESGQAQARALGLYFKANAIIPVYVYVGPLQRTRMTANIICQSGGFNPEISIDERLRELDYGPDENQPESAVIARVGALALDDWECRNVPPLGWIVDVQTLCSHWEAIAAEIVTHFAGKTAFVITSAGIARFAGVLTGDLQKAGDTHGFKMATGAFSILEWHGGRWSIKTWNQKALNN